MRSRYRRFRISLSSTEYPYDHDWAANVRFESENDEQDTACGVPRFVQMSGHNHTSMVAHFNTGEDCLGREILDFLGPHI